jgi:cell wall-associated NlpC family hydrolase
MKWPIFFLKALSQIIGKPYKINCYDLSAFDCYTLIYYLYQFVGYELPKENLAAYTLKQYVKQVQDQKQFFYSVDFDDRQPFDLVVFESAKNVNAHIGMVLDFYHFIHTTDEKNVIIESFNGNYETADIRKIYRWNL